MDLIVLNFEPTSWVTYEKESNDNLTWELEGTSTRRKVKFFSFCRVQMTQKLYSNLFAYCSQVQQSSI